MPNSIARKPLTGIRPLSERKSKTVDAIKPELAANEKLRAYDERQRKERDRLKFATDADIFVTLSFENEKALKQFCQQFGFPELKPHEMVWQGDLPELPTDATPKRRIPKDLYRWTRVPGEPSPINLDAFQAPESANIEQFWTAYFDEFANQLRQPREQLSVLDSPVWFAIVFLSGEQRTEWMKKHRLGQYIPKRGQPETGHYLDGAEVQRLWSEA